MLSKEEYHRNYYQKNKERILSRGKIYYKESVENGSRAKYNSKKVVTHAEYQRQWRKKNIERVHLAEKERRIKLKSLGAKRRSYKKSEESSEKTKWRKIEKSYGINKKRYTEMFNEQGGRCKICLKHQTEFNKNLSIDHCHTSGVVRGLLCSFCNTGLGMFKDNLEIIESAKKYLYIAKSK